MHCREMQVAYSVITSIYILLPNLTYKIARMAHKSNYSFWSLFTQRIETKFHRVMGRILSELFAHVTTKGGKLVQNLLQKSFQGCPMYQK